MPEADPRVFISYSRKDADFALHLQTQLTAAAISTWIDVRHIDGGDSWSQKLQEALDHSQVMLVILSPDSVISTWVAREISYAQQAKLPIIPVYVRPTNLPLAIIDLQYIDFTSNQSAALHELILAIRRAGTGAASELAIAPTIKRPPLQQLPAELTIWSIATGDPPYSVTIPTNSVTIGREFDNLLTLNDLTVSRHHAILAKEAQQWTIKTISETQTLLVNGMAFRETRLRPHDQFLIGNMVLRLEEGDPSAVPSDCPSLLVSTPTLRFVVPLRATTIEIGRSAECGIIVPSLLVARLQARMEKRHETYLIHNLSEKNPLTFRGASVQSHICRSGDTYVIGSAEAGQHVTILFNHP